MKVTYTDHRDKVKDLITRSFYPEAELLLRRAFMKNGGDVTISIENVKRPRTTGFRSQNHCINGYIQQICEETGNDFADVKMYCKQRAIRRGYPVTDKISLVTGDPIPASESEISVEQAGYLIEEIEQLAAELGIMLRR